MLNRVEVKIRINYLEHKAELDKLAERIVYTGSIDAYFGYEHGHLEYRSVDFEREAVKKPNFQGNAVPDTIISREYSTEWKPGDEPYYPVNDEKNQRLYAKYEAMELEMGQA